MRPFWFRETDVVRRTAWVLVIWLVVGGGTRADPPLIPPSILGAGLKAADCDAPLAEAADNLEAYDLGRGRRLIEARCWHAVYNFASILFVLDPAAPAKPRLLQFQVWNGTGFEPSYSLTLPQFDPDSQTLSMRHLGRATGDCGTIGQWTWTGTQFRMTGFWSKEACDGEDFDTDDRWRVFPPRR
jgi:hypothetical protein